MVLPPYLVNVRVRKPDGRPFRLWLPVVLLWPLLVLVFAAAMLVSLAVDAVLFLAGLRYHHYTRLIVGVGHLLAETRGTLVRVRGADTTIVDVSVH